MKKGINFQNAVQKLRCVKMFIISWNCNGKFREKFSKISEFNADIYVIQECENPELSNNAGYKKFAGDNYLWTGDYKSKGLGIFAKGDVKLTENSWDANGHKFFISCKVNDSFDLVGVWTARPHVEEYFDYQEINKEKYTTDTVLIGDFNSNVIWDKKHKGKSHTDVVRILSQIGLTSAYHTCFNEKDGCEKKPTFFLQRKIEKPYHIDYCFMSHDKINSFSVGDYDDWHLFSDHMPLFVDIKEKFA